MDKNIDHISCHPLATIVMPAYNAEKHIKQAIDSIIGQTYKDFILMIVNDGSTDKTEEIILSYHDDRIKYIKNEKNIGLVNTLSNSVELTQTKYYARMDADDIAVPQRIEWQIQFMEDHPDVGVCGGLFEIFGNENSFSERLLGDENIKATLLFGCKILHPSIMIRTGILKDNKINFDIPFKYNDDYGHKILELEDYALWHKLKSITKFENLDKVLIKYRIEGQNLSTQKMDLILERKKKIYSYILKELSIEPSENNLLFHISLNNFNQSTSSKDIALFRKHLDSIIIANKEKNIYPLIPLEKVVNQKWDQLFYHIPPKGLKYVFNYWKNSKNIRWPHVVYLLKYFFNKFFRKE